MQLGIRMLDNVSGVNAYDSVPSLTMMEGDTPTIYLQLVDVSRNRASAGFAPAGLRYMPDVGATLQVTLDSIDDARKVVRLATQPFASDPSIWAIQLTSADLLRGTVSIKTVLTEGLKVSSALNQGGLGVQSLDGMTRY